MMGMALVKFLYVLGTRDGTCGRSLLNIFDGEAQDATGQRER